MSYFVERYVKNRYCFAFGPIVTRKEEIEDQATVRFGGILNRLKT